MALVRTTTQETMAEETMARAARRMPEEAAEFRRRMDATTEQEIRRHMIEDGEDPDADLPPGEHTIPPQMVRKKLGMTQTQFAELLDIPVATLRNWEQKRFCLEPAVRALLRLIYSEPEAALARPAPRPGPPETGIASLVSARQITPYPSPIRFARCEAPTTLRQQHTEVSSNPNGR